MNARRFFGSNARDVFKQIKLELGPDALILSNKQVDGGVEIVAMADTDMSDLVRVADRQHDRAVDSRIDSRIEARIESRVESRDDFRNEPRIERAVPAPRREAAAPRATAPAAPAPRARQNARHELFAPVIDAAPAAVEPALAPAAAPVAPAGVSAEQSSAETQTLLAELKAMKAMLAEQLASMSWNETVRRRPLRAQLMRELIGSGFSAQLSRAILDRLPDDYAEAAARAWVGDVLARNLSCGSETDLVDRGGVIALVGPTGVGKTTTAAKLAARCAVKFGASKLGLITTDTYRIGAQDQLRTYGKILGAPVLVAQDAADLEQAIQSLAGRHMIIIDTVGMGQRDARVTEQHAMLSVNGIQRLACLNATSQAETLDEVITRYRGNGLAGAVLTKLDEAVRVGCALDVVIRNKLPVMAVSSGQRVPEDLHAPNARVLVHNALRRPAAGSSSFDLSEEEIGLFAAVPAAGSTGARA